MKCASIFLSMSVAALCIGGVWTSATAAPVSLPAVTVNAFELECQEVALQTTIVDVDQSNRTVTLMGPEGQEETIEVGGNVRDLSDLKPGDRVSTHYLRAAAVQLLPANSGEPGVEYSSGADTADDASDTLFQSHHTQTVTTTLAAVDVAHKTVTLLGADGHKRIIDVHQLKPSIKLDKLKIGDLVRVTFVEAFAIALEPKIDAEKAR